VSPAPPFKQCDARKQEGIDNQTLDQHCDGEQCEEANSIPRLPFFLRLDFLPNQQADEKNRQCQWHVCAHECRQARSQQIQSKRTERNEASN
jgi:hypothetical protein